MDETCSTHEMIIGYKYRVGKYERIIRDV